MTPPTHAALLLALGTLATPLFLTLLAPHLPQRRNPAGRTIPTAAGTAFLPIILLTVVLSTLGGIGLDGVGLAYLLYALLAGVAGFVDEVWGGAEARGVWGRLGGLARGRAAAGVL